MTHSDCDTYIIVLGHLMHKDGSLDIETVQRVNLAFQVDKYLPANAIIFCGWAYRHDSDITIAEAMKGHALSKRPDLQSRLLIQPFSRDTVGDAFFSRLLLQNVCKANAPTILVMTSCYHARRALLIFKFIFHGYAKRVQVKRCDLASDDSSRQLSEAKSIAAFRKTFAGVDQGNMSAIRQVMAANHPFYNGNIYPVIGPLESIVDEIQELI